MAHHRGIGLGSRRHVGSSALDTGEDGGKHFDPQQRPAVSCLGRSLGSQEREFRVLPGEQVRDLLSGT